MRRLLEKAFSVLTVGGGSSHSVAPSSKDKRLTSGDDEPLLTNSITTSKAPVHGPRNYCHRLGLQVDVRILYSIRDDDSLLTEL